MKKGEIDFQNSDIGYYCYVTLAENSDEVKIKTDQLPFALQKVEIINEQVSDFTRQRMGDKGKNLNAKYSRLIGHHYEKNRQLYDGESLQFALKKGLKIKEIHTVYSFKQIEFLRNFILRQIEKRTLAKSTMESLMFKLICNSIFGKFLCNQLLYAMITYICTDKHKLVKKLSSENFVNLYVLNENKALVISKKKKIKFCLPSYVGYSVLEKSRRVMKTIFYDILLEIYEKKQLFFDLFRH